MVAAGVFAFVTGSAGRRLRGHMPDKQLISDCSPSEERTAPEGIPLPRRTRILIAVVAGVLWGFYAWISLSISGELAGDFTWPLRAARLLLSGDNPYSVIRPTGPYPFDAYFKYPLPAALLALPFATLPPEVAAGLFVGVSIGALAWFLGRDGGLRLPILVSGCLLSAIRSAQWAPLLTAAFLASRYGVGLGVIKPNLGAALFVSKPSLRGATLAAVLLLVSTIVQPAWFWNWLDVIRGAEAHYRIPALGGHGLLAIGPLFVLLLLRWRSADARLIAALACVPQVPSLYDQLPLLLVARTRMESWVISITSLAGLAWWISSGQDPFRCAWLPLVAVYTPATIVVLLREVREHPLGRAQLN